MRQILTALLAALASWPAIATELVETANALPLDAHELSYGDGWECNRGFKKRNQSCVKITAAFQDILELECCNCNASDSWNKSDALAIRDVGASSCCRCKKLRSLKTLIDLYFSGNPNKINDPAHLANVRVASSNLVSCSKKINRVANLGGPVVVLVSRQ